MRIVIAAGGKARRAPEAALASDYLKRFNALAPSLGFGPAELQEAEARRAATLPETQKRESDLLSALAPTGSLRVVLDERGRQLKSRGFAEKLGQWRDRGTPAVTFFIGGADGLDSSLRDKADMALAFGAATWPHLLVRVLLAEQLYRAATILAGHPYHRD